MEEHPFTVNYHYLSEYKSKFLAYYKSARDKETQGEVTSQVESFVSKPIVSPSRSQQPSTPGNSKTAKKSQLSSGFFGGSEEATQEPNGIAKVLAGLTEMGIMGIRPQDLYRILPPWSQLSISWLTFEHTSKVRGLLTFLPFMYKRADERGTCAVAYKRYSDNVPQAVDREVVRGVERDILKTLCTKLGTSGPSSEKICAELAQESPQVPDGRQELMKRLERLQSAMVELMEVRL
jgi:hypothetical protein